jgi:hypothetical protein
MKDPGFTRLAGGAPHMSYDDILGHPRLPEARKLYLDRFLALYGRDPFHARLLIETGRFLVFHVAVILDAAHDPERRDTWFTVGRLKRELAAFGFASDRQIDHLVRRLHAVGYLSFTRPDQDRRVRLLKPSEKMLAHDRAWLAAHYAPLTVVSPYNDYAPVMRGDPDYQTRHRRAAIAFVPFAGKLLALAPEMMLFFNHAAGHLVSASLLQAGMASPDAQACIPYGEIAERIGVSRTHVRTILLEAQDAGLVRLHGRGGHQVEILPLFWSSYDRGIAAGMYGHDMVHALVTGRRALQPSFNKAAAERERAAS